MSEAAGGGPQDAVVLDGVTKRYATGTLALDGIDLRVARGEFVCFVGASGCGKSTLLNIISNLDQATSGSVSVVGHPALMFQEHALMPWLSALDNVALPMRLAGVPKGERLERAQALGALDAMTRDLLHDELESVWRARGLTVLFVTHNVREAVWLADRVILLSSRPGRVVQEYRIDVPRPRRLEDPAVGQATAQITAALRKEVARHGD